MNIHPSHNIPNGPICRCLKCGTSSQSTLEQICASLDNPHPSHKMAPSDSIGSLVECIYCGGKDPNVLNEPCSRGEAGKLENMDFSKLEERVIVAMADDAIQPERFRLTGRGHLTYVNDEVLNDLLKKAVAAFEAMTPEEQAAHLEAQRKSWVAGEMGIAKAEREEGMHTRAVIRVIPPGISYKRIEDEPYAVAGTELDRVRKLMRRCAHRIVSVQNEVAMVGRHHRELQQVVRELKEASTLCTKNPGSD